MIYVLDNFLDQDMLEYGELNYHPLDNAATVTIGSKDLLTFLREVHGEPEVINVPEREG